MGGFMHLYGNIGFALAGMLIAGVGIAQAESRFDVTGKYAGTYFCQGDAMAGVSYSEAAKRWQGTVFAAGSKVIMKVMTTAQLVSETDESLSRVDYIVMVNDLGSKVDWPCRVMDVTDRSGVYKDGSFRCATPFNVYNLNFENLRYTDVYLPGYVDGQDNNRNTPSVTAGICSRIN
jgi:hypothetical protein